VPRRFTRLARLFLIPAARRSFDQVPLLAATDKKDVLNQLQGPGQGIMPTRRGASRRGNPLHNGGTANPLPLPFQRRKRQLDLADLRNRQRGLQQRLVRRAGMLLGGLPQKLRILESIEPHAASVRTKRRDDRAG
jgi:hypothetical protein